MNTALYKRKFDVVKSAVRRFYCAAQDISSAEICLNDKQVHYIKNVLRLKKDDKILVFDGKGKQYNCVIVNIKSKEVRARIISSEFCLSKEAAYKVTLVQALPNRPQKMDFVIEKATELGVDAIIPLAADRSVQGRDGVTPPLQNKINRWRKIASEASRQCGRVCVPEVKEIMSVQKALTILSDDSIKLFPCIDKDTIPLPDALENVRATHRVALTIAVFIGPEGDFTKEEMDAAKESGFNLVSLGERVLRTETAGLYVLSVLDYIFG